ncbi:rod shape-determining protein MreC [Clostridium intestinale]|uniref:Cell shape-determining protein MreC n=1 Tax=Clostridium intestinale TaxID=36845 RepID=A0A7D6VNM1_9CLOT|nr:rod shape-determining protein MreC [Clostridium intestinale]QLY79047.1 rod shape-determining protein MreC [Clostridium intestinale]
MRLFKNKLAVTIIVLSVSFLIIIVYSFRKENKTIFESGAGAALNPIQKLAYKVTDNFKGAVDFFYNFSEVKAENRKLSEENKDLRIKLIEYNRLKEENESLRKVVDFANQDKNFDYVGTNIIGHSGGGFSGGYIIDKGSKNQIEKGMVVVSDNGLVGQVTSVGDNWAVVQSLINENIAIASKIESTQETTGVLQGYKDSKNKLLTKLYNIPIDSPIKAGDVILTSGVGEIPKDIRIGEVISVEDDNVKVMKNAVVQPYVDFNKLESLFVVVPKEKRNIKVDN